MRHKTLRVPVELAEEITRRARIKGVPDADYYRLLIERGLLLQVPELGTSVFIVPGRYVKNGDDRLIVLNRIALSVVEAQRGKHPLQVFTYKGKPTTRMLNKAWLRARNVAGLPQVRVHDLKHTFGRRLRAAGVSFEDRQDLLGHRSARITTHYSAAELSKLLEAANRVCDSGERRPELVVLRRLSVG